MAPTHCTKVIPKRGATTDKWLVGNWWTWLLHFHLTAEKHGKVFFLYFPIKKNPLPFLLPPSRKVHGELPISKDFIRYRANLWFQPLSGERKRTKELLYFPLTTRRRFNSGSSSRTLSIWTALLARGKHKYLWWRETAGRVWWSSGCPGVCAGTFGEKIGDV